MSLAKFKDLINHERYQAIAIGCVVVLLLWFFGCESKVRSLANPQTLVTRAGLEAEVDFYLAQAEIRFNDLDRQDAFKTKLMEAAAIAAEGGKINILGLILANIGILGAGAAVDNVRKRKIIKSNLTTYVNSKKANSVPTNA